MADRNILIIGAGKIGRSFIGQLFGNQDYMVVFVDINLQIVSELNSRGSYPVIIKGPDYEERLVIEPVRAIYAREKDKVAKAVSEASVMAISVGKTAFTSVASLVAAGLLERDQKSPGKVLDIILAENMRSASHFFREKLREILPSSYPLNERVGLVETSIGKMAPIMRSSDLEKDLLQIFAEPYNTLILDKKGFKGEIPRIKEFSLKEHMKPWVERKAFIHNLGHATAAYFGHLKHPEFMYMHEVLGDMEVFDFTRKVMQESAVILMMAYPDEFTKEDLWVHIDDLLTRFCNRNLGDTVFRVGSDLARKLGSDDRFMRSIRVANQLGQPCGLIIEAMAMGFLFKGTNEFGKILTEDIQFHHAFNNNPDQVFQEICGLDNRLDKKLITNIIRHLHELRSKHLLAI